MDDLERIIKTAIQQSPSVLKTNRLNADVLAVTYANIIIYRSSPNRLRHLSVESEVLPQHAESEDRAQHP